MRTYRIIPATLSCVPGEKGMMTYLSFYGEKIMRPYVFWIIEGADRNVIVDTAIHAAQYQGHHPCFRDLPIQHRLSFEEALARASMRPEDVDLVIQTHLHFDHCANTQRCPKAKVIVQAEELEFARNPHPVFAGMYSRALLENLDFVPLRGRQEILPGIEVIPAPGHTPGCQAVSINTAKGRAVITGFCCVKENFYPAEDVRARGGPLSGSSVLIPGIHSDARQAYESMLKIKDMADILLPVHEPEIMEMDVIP